MTQLSEIKQNIDVICEHKTDGTIVPLKLRVKDDDGEYQAFAVKSYKDLTQYSEYLGPDERSSPSHTWTFDCKIVVFRSTRIVRLFFNAYENRWRIVSVR